MNPFHDTKRVPTEPSHPLGKTKGNRSLSRIEGMTVGDVRQCFSQMRNTPNLTSSTTLWCGMTAGTFALRYLVNTAGSSRKRKSAPSAS